VQSSDEVLAHPQLEHRSATVVADIPGSGPATVLAPPFVFDGERRSHTSAPPALGEHNADVLASWLDYDAVRLGEAAAGGAFGPPVSV
jgi:crotonobetainyl-CoA:carnitine CoA-transferase CaiB-like acyl-CoA transferase